MLRGSTGASNCFSPGLGTILPFFLVSVGISLPNIALIEGLIFSVGSVGALVGVALATRIARRIGVGLSIIASMIIGGLGAIPYYLSGSLTASPLFALFVLVVTC